MTKYSRGANHVKRGIDILLALVLLLFSTPLFTLIAIAIKLNSRGSVFFGHPRIGRQGKQFTCIKFRTMQVNASAILEQILATDEAARLEWLHTQKLKQDPRVTPIGKFLRCYSLDELPQLWNVLKGEMSLVGPRPIVQEEMPKYRENIHYYLAIRPGMTGLWQVSGRNDTDYDRRVAFDIQYIQNWSLYQDIVILYKTILVVLTGKGAY